MNAPQAARLGSLNAEAQALLAELRRQLLQQDLDDAHTRLRMDYKPQDIHARDTDDAR